MNPNPSKIPGSVRLVVLLVIQVIAIQACSPSDAVICPVERLLLDARSFPGQAVPGELISPLPDGTRYSGGRGFYLGKGIANHSVYGFSKSKRAAEEFEQQQKDPAFSEWQVPDEVRGLLGSSTQHQIVCGEQHQIPMCKAIAQYDNYFIYFNMHMWPEEATETDLVVLLQEIDGRMSHCLSGTPIPQND